MSVKPQRPRSITLVIVALALLGTLQAARVVALSEQSALLLQLEVRPDPRLLMLAAAAWAVIFWVTAAGLWRGKSKARALAPLLLVLYAVYEFVILALLARDPLSGQRLIQYGLIAVACALFCYWALNRGPARSYYLEERPESS